MSTHISVPPQLLLERILTLEIVRVTERAAVSAARLRGHGNEKAADQAAVDAMRRELNKLPIQGTVVIGEGERDEAPMLFIGETVGMHTGPEVDIAVDPLEGTTLCAKNMPGSIATMAMADGGTLLHAPDVYMQKIAVGPGYAKGVVELDASPADNVRRLAKAKGVDPSAITVLVLDRPRHSDIINGVRSTGAAVRLITDGDVAGVIRTPLASELAPKTILTRTQVQTLITNPQMPEIKLTEEMAARYLVVDYDKYFPLAPGIALIKAPGHTPGHLVLVISDQSERALLLGDAITCPVQLEEEEWGCVFDVDGALARSTRNFIRYW